MTLNSNLWFLFVPPVAGGIIGYFTNDLAIKMLFRPYRAYHIGKYRVPLTPGLIPRNQGRLAKRVADTIMGSLLTPAELQGLARRLLSIERIRGAILWLLDMARQQLTPGSDRKTTRILAGILHDLFGESLPRLLKVWSRRDDFLVRQVDKIFDDVLLEFQLTEQQASQLADWLMQVALSPNSVRLAIVDFLTDRNIVIIDENFREKSSGTYWIVAHLLGLRNTLVRLRNYCLDEKEKANAQLAEVIDSLDLQSRLKEWLQNLSLQNLPVSTVRQLRKTLRDSVRKYIRTEGADLLRGLGDSVDFEHAAQAIVNRLRTSTVVNSSLELIGQELALVLDRYLEKDLEKIVAKVIPILAIDSVIVDRVNATSPENLEAAVEGIVKSELQAIVNLGGILGVIIGLLQSGLLFFQNSGL
ncbi:DUF445 family protein [Geitlerinema sp. CS-897]|uniref:DUF445 domain-containing protein n=1 Tax=Baaleninema simplex TaxID=2862350 RepID=UPI00034C19CD|nr:DUF445 family protein [Baaleninema simplex]MDC0832624.1 DUF445 family protein [Geitlerinema sp. CS-897]